MKRIVRMGRHGRPGFGFACRFSFSRSLTLKQFFLIVAFSWYAVLCLIIEPDRPHAAFPIGSNPHAFTLIPQGLFADVIPGKVITLKKVTKADIPRYHEIFSEQARTMLSFPTSSDISWTQAYVEYEMWRAQQGEMLYYGIHDNIDKQLIGIIDIRAFWRQDPGMIGFWLNEKYYGGGRMKEAVDLLVETYFKSMDVAVINAYVEPFNQRSFAACKKFGFEFVGFSQGKKDKADKRFFYVLERYR